MLYTTGRVTEDGRNTVQFEMYILNLVLIAWYSRENTVRHMMFQEQHVMCNSVTHNVLWHTCAALLRFFLWNNFRGSISVMLHVHEDSSCVAVYGLTQEERTEPCQS